MNSSNLEAGDYVVAIKDATYKYHPEEYYVFKDKKYKVISIDEQDEDDNECFSIIDESGDEHLFSYEFLDIHSEDYLFNKDKLCIDHCYITNKIRGILCRNCNSAIGYFKDNIEVIKKSIKYLKKCQN